MSNSIVAKRYANALFQLAKEKNQINKLGEEVAIVKAVFGENKDLLNIFANPKLSIEKKKEMIAKSFASVSTELRNTLMILVERHREDIFVEVAEHFQGLINEETGIEDATVVSVQPLTETEKKEIATIFSKKVGKQDLRIQNVIDQAVLGGLKISIGNQIFDGTIKGKLDRLSRQLLAK